MSRLSATWSSPPLCYSFHAALRPLPFFFRPVSGFGFCNSPLTNALAEHSPPSHTPTMMNTAGRHVRNARSLRLAARLPAGTILRCNRPASTSQNRAPQVDEKTQKFKLELEDLKKIKDPKLRGWEKRTGGDSHRFPDWIEKWDVGMFKSSLGLLGGANAALLYANPSSFVTYGVLGASLLYAHVGYRDMNQTAHAIPHNFPVLGNVRYFFESIRPEIRQYFVESDHEALPFAREQRSVAYQRAKNMRDTLPFGTRRDVYETGYEWANHSMFPTHVSKENSRVSIGGPDCKQPYSASLLNVSAMSYGAISKNAILALNAAAHLGGFYHNTGEGGISRWHLEPGGDIVWNIGTGYFGCRNPDGTFNSDMFVKNATREQVKMIEIKLSQGAKPGHGGLLPGSKVTPTIAEARGVEIGEDCNSPPAHTAFQGPEGLIRFVAQLRELSGGKPVGFKLCVGHPTELAAIVQAMVKTGITPDFITVDGAEGGTGAAPPEFSNHVGMPLQEGLTLVHNFLIGAGLRNRVKIIASGKVLTGFSLVKTLALGADVTNAARAMMFALGCIQALKCNTNTCPTGITTQDAKLQAGLDPANKAKRVLRYQSSTVHAALEIIGAVGLTSPDQLRPQHIMKRVSSERTQSFAQKWPTVQPNCLIDGTAPEMLTSWWEDGARFLEDCEDGEWTPVATPKDYVQQMST